MKKRALLFLALSLLLLLSACGGTAGTPSATPEASAPPLRVAIIFDGIIADGGWNQDGFTEMQALADTHGFELSWQENVSPGDAADVIRSFAADGCDLVIDNEQYHAEAMAQVAPEFPDVTFACVNGYVSADNMIAVTGDMWQHIYLAGIISGAATQTGKLGLITYSTTSDSARTMLAAYTAGARYANPDVTVTHVATGSFSDLAIGKELAVSLMDQGCDVILCNSGDTNVTVMEAAAQRGVYSVGSIVDHNDVSQDYVLGSAMLPPSNILRIMVEGYLDGTLTGSAEVQVMGLKEGIEEFRVNPAMQDKLDPAVFELLEQAQADIIAGKITLPLS